MKASETNNDVAVAMHHLKTAIDYARKKHPEFPQSLDAGLAIITEEYLELTREVNDIREAAVSYDEGIVRALSEAEQVAVTALRLCIAIRKRISEG